MAKAKTTNTQSSQTAGAGAAGAANAAAGAAAGAASDGLLKRWYAKAKNSTSGLGNYLDPDAYSWHKFWGKDATTGKKFAPGITYTNPKTGVPKNIGKWGNIAGLAMQGIDAARGWGDYQNTLNANDDLMSKIQVSALGNPLLSSYLTQDQLNLLGDVQSGRYSDDADAEDFFKGALGGLGDAIIPTLSGLAIGGVPGALIGGIGTLVNSGIDNLSASSGQNTTELQALYQALQDADAQYRSMKRPNFTGLGIQQQYQNMYA